MPARSPTIYTYAQAGAPHERGVGGCGQIRSPARGQEDSCGGADRFESHDHEKHIIQDLCMCSAKQCCVHLSYTPWGSHVETSSFHSLYTYFIYIIYYIYMFVENIINSNSYIFMIIIRKTLHLPPEHNKQDPEL